MDLTVYTGTSFYTKLVTSFTCQKQLLYSFSFQNLSYFIIKKNCKQIYKQDCSFFFIVHKNFCKTVTNLIQFHFNNYTIMFNNVLKTVSVFPFKFK